MNPTSGDEDSRDKQAISELLDEVYRLRTALAYEALVTRAHLGYKTFPKSRRPFAERQIERMQQGSRGQAFEAYYPISHLVLNTARKEANMPETLTRARWEADHGRAQ